MYIYMCVPTYTLRFINCHYKSPNFLNLFKAIYLQFIILMNIEDSFRFILYTYTLFPFSSYF